MAKKQYINGLAKPVLYNGVWFDSQLEARWAKFLDLCGFKWEKPKTGFLENDKKRSWLPDFRVEMPDGVVWLLEVKPSPDFLDMQKYVVGAYRQYPLAFCFANPNATLSLLWEKEVSTFKNYLPSTHEALWEQSEYE